MSGAAEKKAAKASAAARKKYRALIAAFAGFYFLLRLAPGYFGGQRQRPGRAVLLRFLAALAAQAVCAAFLVDAAADAAGAGKRDLGQPGKGEHFFDAFYLLGAVEVAAAVEFQLRGRESVWWVAAVLPAGGAYAAYQAFQGSALSGLLGLATGRGGGGGDDDEVSPELAAKRQRRKDLKEKRAGLSVRK